MYACRSCHAQCTHALTRKAFYERGVTVYEQGVTVLKIESSRGAEIRKLRPAFFLFAPPSISTCLETFTLHKNIFNQENTVIFSGTFAPKPLTQAFNFFGDLKIMFFPIFRGWRNLIFWGCWQTGGKCFSGRSWCRFLAPGLLLYFVSSEAVNKPELTSLFPRNDISMVDTKNKKLIGN